MSIYLWIDVIIILIPLVLVLDRRVGYYRKVPAVLFSAFLVGGCFVVWDALATRAGHWAFNARYVTGARFIGLPVEEIIFFIAIPFSCLFIYETVCYFCPEKTLKIPAVSVLGAGILLLLLAGIYLKQGYTLIVLLVSAFTLFCGLGINPPEVFRSRRYWTFLALSYIPFLLFNYVLTALPVVIYNPRSVWGARVGSIPLEDFFYNFSLQTLLLLTYLKVRAWRAMKAE